MSTLAPTWSSPPTAATSPRTSVARLLQRWGRGPRRTALLAACCIWLVATAVVDVQVLGGVPVSWLYAAPVLVAALFLPPSRVSVLGAVALFLYTAAALRQQAPPDPMGISGVGVAILAGVAVLWARRREQQQARAARHEAEAAARRELDRRCGEMLATITHELRSPLTVVHGYAQLLASQAAAADPGWVAQTAERVHARSADLIRLVNDLVDTEHAGRGELAIEREDFDLAPGLRELAETWRSRVGAAGLADEVPAHLFVTGDPQRVRQVVTNLLENARKYAPESAIVLRARAADGWARVEVEDQGPGIPLEEQRHIWERLYRGRAAAGRNVVRGSGIGLALVKALVQAQGGHVGVESAPGSGARFWFDLPAAPASVATPNSGGTTEERGGPQAVAVLPHVRPAV